MPFDSPVALDGAAPPDATEAGDASLPETGPRGARAVVFLSSASMAGDTVGGPVGADGLCQRLAEKSGYSASFVAWISDSMSNAIDRLDAGGPWFLTDPTRDAMAFPTKAAIPQGPQTPITSTEDGSASTPTLVWTGTRDTGQVSIATCMDWKSHQPFDQGTVGSIADAGFWTNATTANCDFKLPIYCFQNGP